MGRAAGLAGMAGGLALGLLACAIGARAAQPAGERKSIPPSPPMGAEIKLLGASECKFCHEEEAPEKRERYQKTLGYRFIRLWENKVWGTHDLHADAFKNLLTDYNKGPSKAPANAVATVMEKNLRQAYADQPDYKVTTDTRCLACHATTVNPVTPAAVAAWTPKSFSTAEGVSCEMCHGHGTAYKDIHQSPAPVPNADPDAEGSQYVPWREADTTWKSNWGLVNLRDPAVAVARCASCHVGNLAEGRFVRHEFYAAGHPPLPPLDLLAYSREQPRHWGLPGERGLTYFDGLDADKAWKVFHFKKGESAAARRFAESAVATLKANLDLTAQLAADAEKTNEGLDYSAFDCYACHHDLKYPSDRQARGYVGPPGRPLFRPAPFALARVVTEHAATFKGGEAFAGRAAKIVEVEKTLAKAFGAKTFGDPALIQKALADRDAVTRETLTAFGNLSYDKAARDSLLDAVSAAAGRPVADPEVAQLLVWAHETLELDKAGPPSSPKDDQAPPPPKAVADLHAKVGGFVVTRLRPGAKFMHEVTPTTPQPKLGREPVAARIGERMRVFNAFDARQFQPAFADPRPKK